MSKYFEYMQERDEVLECIKSGEELLSRLKRELKSLDDKIRDVIPEKKTTLDLTPLEPLVINNSENTDNILGKCANANVCDQDVMTIDTSNVSQFVVSNIKLLLSHLQLIIHWYYTLPESDNIQNVCGSTITDVINTINDSIHCVTKAPISISCGYIENTNNISVIINIEGTQKEIVVTDDGIDNHVTTNDIYAYINAYITNNGVNYLVMLPEVGRGSMTLDGIIKDIEYFINDAHRDDSIVSNLKSIAGWLQFVKFR